jgi:hypothetical protein
MLPPKHTKLLSPPLLYAQERRSSRTCAVPCNRRDALTGDDGQPTCYSILDEDEPNQGQTEQDLARACAPVTAQHDAQTIDPVPAAVTVGTGINQVDQAPCSKWMSPSTFQRTYFV